MIADCSPPVLSWFNYTQVRHERLSATDSRECTRPAKTKCESLLTASLPEQGDLARADGQNRSDNSRYFVICLSWRSYLTTYRASQGLCGVGNSGGASRSSFDFL
jgi:hypothetical protein